MRADPVNTYLFVCPPDWCSFYSRLLASQAGAARESGVPVTLPGTRNTRRAPGT